jgi:hypothetical protein
MKSLANLPREPKPPEEVIESVEETAGDGSVLLLALLLSRMGNNPELIQSLAANMPGGEKLRLALKFGSELKRCGGGLSTLRVVSRYTKQDTASIEKALARSEQLRKTIESFRSGSGMEAFAQMAGINPLIASMLTNRSGGLTPEMLMNLMGRRPG